MKRLLIATILIILALNPESVSGQGSPLKGTWKLVSYKYILPGCTEEDLTIRKAIRVYNDTHFSVLWVYPDSTTETCVARYALEGEKLSLKILSHSDFRSFGREITGISKITGGRLFHFVDLDGYIIMEIYEPLKNDNPELASAKPDPGNLHLMATELIKYARQKGAQKLIRLGENYLKEALKMDPSLINAEY